MYWLLHKNIKLRIVNKYEINQTAYSHTNLHRIDWKFFYCIHI